MAMKACRTTGRLRPDRVEDIPRRIVVVHEARYATHPQPAGLVRALTGLGHLVTVVDGNQDNGSGAGRGRRRDRLRAVMARADVIVGRGRSRAVLATLDAAAEMGVPVVDPAAAVRRVWDKAVMARVLSRGGVPTPATFFAPIDRLRERVPAPAYPLILKPVHGDNARGLRIVASGAELDRSRWPERTALAQSYLPGDGRDLKLYVVGGHVAAVRKPSPITPCATRGIEHVAVDGRLAGLARRCGLLFGLTVFGVDCLHTSGGPLVVEVNDFPNFTAVPGADLLLARHVLATAGSRDGRGRR
jgi:ribosomal protein S6--L-glutamate ligase